MNIQKVKVAVIGVGVLGEHHARVYSEDPGADLVAVVDIRADRAAEIAARLGCAAVTDFRKILDEVEAVSLAVPTSLHGEIGTAIAARGLHLLVEKPIAHSLSAADVLIKTCKDSKVVFHVGHSERFNPAFSAVREFITEPRFFEAHRLGVFVPRSLDVDVVLDLMIHDLDLIVHLVDQPIREIRAVGIPILTSRIDIANARLEFDNGCVANITASRVSTEKIRKLRFFQPNDYVSIDFHQQEARVLSLTEGRQILPRPLEIRRDQPLRLEIAAFLEAVRGEAPAKSVCTGWEARRALKLALQLQSQMATK